MSQDIVADALNQIMNAKRAGKKELTIGKYSKLLLSILAIGKLRGYIQDYKVENNELRVTFGKINFCRAVKPRYLVKVRDLDKYVRRYLPARDMGIVLVSTNKGLMTHQTAQEKNIGGSIVAFMY